MEMYIKLPHATRSVSIFAKASKIRLIIPYMYTE